MKEEPGQAFVHNFNSPADCLHTNYPSPLIRLPTKAWRLPWKKSAALGRAPSEDQVSHNQNLVSKWSTQNHVKKSEGGRAYFWLGPPLTNLHPGFDCGSGIRRYALMVYELSRLTATVLGIERRSRAFGSLVVFWVTCACVCVKVHSTGARFKQYVCVACATLG